MSNKNLLVICNSFPNQDNTFVGGVFVKDQVRYLSHYFDNVYVISPIAYGIERLRGIKQLDYKFDNVSVFFPKYFNNPLFWYHGKSLWSKLETRAVHSLIKKEHILFDLIHAHFTWPSGAVASKLKQIYNVPVVITEHTSNTFIKSIKNREQAFIDAWNGANIIIRVKQSDQSLFEHVGISLEKIVSIPNGYDGRLFHPIDKQRCREILNLPKDKKILLNVGNLYDAVKGHKYLIEAISKIIRKQKDVLCIIVGGGKLRTAIEHQIRSLGLEDYVILADRRPHDEIPIWLNACDIFVLPSLNEGNPTVLPEALGCGRPFVGTRVGGIPELIISEEYGLLVEPANSNDLAEKILVALVRGWNEKTILHHAEQYNWENVTKEILRSYDRVLNDFVTK